MENKIKDFLKTEIIGDPKIEIENNEDLLGGGLMNSMGLMRLIAFIENDFGFKIPPQDMVIDHFRDIEAITDYIKTKK
jgi:acyl carrier protein